MSTRKSHWEEVYFTKQPHEVSWTQDVPQTTLNFVHSLNLPKSAEATGLSVPYLKKMMR